MKKQLSPAQLARNSKGGKAVVEKYGPGHMAKLGKLGYLKALAAHPDLPIKAGNGRAKQYFYTSPTGAVDSVMLKDYE